MNCKILDLIKEQCFLLLSTPNESVAYVVKSVYLENTTKGHNGEDFELELSDRCFEPGEVITYDKFEGVELFIRKKEPSKDGLACIYTVQTIPDGDKGLYIDSKFIQPGVMYFRSSARVPIPTGTAKFEVTCDALVRKAINKEIFHSMSTEEQSKIENESQLAELSTLVMPFLGTISVSTSDDIIGYTIKMK